MEAVQPTEESKDDHGAADRQATGGIVRYHPESFAAQDECDQYLGYLSAAHEAVLDDLKARLLEAGLEAELRAQHQHAIEGLAGGLDCCLLRFLRARNFDVTQALQMLTEDVQWRRTEGVPALRDVRPHEALAMENPQLMWPHQMAWFSGFDYQERPVIFSKWGTFEIWKAEELTGYDDLVRFHIWSQEQAVALCEANSRRTGFAVETFVSVLDIQGMRMAQVTSQFLKLVRASASIDQLHYPERLGEIFILNPPAMFSYVWAVVRPWLPAETQRKVKILAGPRQWRPALQALVGAHQLLPEYGGTAADMRGAWLLENAGAAEYWARHGGADPTMLALGGGAGGGKGEGEDGHSLDEGEGAADALQGMWGEIDTDRHTLSSSANSEDFFDCSADPPTLWRGEPRWWTSRVVKRWLQHRSQQSLRRALMLSNGVLISTALVALCFCVYTLNSAVWTPEMLELIIWAFGTVCGLATLVLCLGFAGAIACQAGNTVALRCYAAVLQLLALVLFVIGVLCINVGAGNDGIIGRAIERLNLSDGVVKRIEAKNALVGGATITLCFCSLLSSALARALIAKLNEGDTRLGAQRKLQSALWILSLVLLLFTLVGMTFGAYNSWVAIQLSLGQLVFTQYLLFASGTGTLISSLFGLWLSRSSPRLSALKAGIALLVPLVLVLLAAALLSFRSITAVESAVARELDDDGRVADVTVDVQKTLLIAGVLECDCALFQLANLLTVYALFRRVRRDPRFVGDGQAEHLPLTTPEMLILTWALWSGFVHIFFDGTYAVMNQVINTDSSSWFTWLWRIWGQVDSRFTRGDSLVVATNTAKALVSGPLCLYYAWAVYNRRPNRFTVGTLVCAIQLYSIMLYVLTEAMNDFRSTFDRQKDNAGGLFACFIIVNVLRFTLPLPILLHDARRVRDLADREDRLRLLNEEDQAAASAANKSGDIELGSVGQQRGTTLDWREDIALASGKYSEEHPAALRRRSASL